MKLSKVERFDAEATAKEILAKSNFPIKSSWLITGASGFIGTQLVNVLNAIKKSGKDIKITILENGIRGGIRKWYFEDCELLECDVTKPWPILPKHDYVIHLASVASPVYYREYPLETLDANVNGSRNALKFAKQNEANLLLLSSSEIYGDPEENHIPTDETYRGNVDCLGPRACYDESKRLVETLSWIYQNHHKTNVIVARPFNFYGPGMRLDDGRVLPDIFSAIVNNSDIVLHSDGTPTRTFCYIQDAVNALIMMTLNAEIKTSLNVGNKKGEISMRTLAETAGLIGKELGWKGEVKICESMDKNFLTNNPQRRAPNVDKIESLMNWQARTELEDGLRKSMLHFQEISNL